MHADTEPPHAAMDGFPPSPASRVTAENWYRNPWLRWGFLNRSKLIRGTAVWRGDGPVWTLPRDGDAPDTLRELAVDGRGGARTTLDALAADCGLDGLVVLHRGRVIHERWLRMRPQDLHATASVSKAILGLVAGTLAARGVLDLARRADACVPELAGTAMGDATLQQLLDMQAAVARPSMADRPGMVGGQDGGVYELLGLLPRAPGAPADFYDWMLAKPRHGAPGERFYYDNGQVEAVAWAIRRVTGAPIAELVGELLWAPMGAERDAWYACDETGAEMTSGGLAATLRDLARLGETMRRGGEANGRQVVPEAVVADTRRGGDRALFAASDFGPRMPGASYRNLWWIAHDPFDGFHAVGRYGQRVYIAPRAEVVVAYVGSMEGPPPNPNDALLVRACHSVAKALS